MVKKIIILFTIIFIISTVAFFPQEKEKINQKRKELSSLKSQISELQNQLKYKALKEKKSFVVLNNYNKQTYLLNQLINKLHKEEKQKQIQITYNKKKIEQLKNDIKSLQDNYSKYVVAIYKYGKISELESLFDAQSLEQAILRYKYLQKFSEDRRKNLSDLKNKENELLTTKSRLQKQKKEKSLIAIQKQTEEKDAQLKLLESKKIITAIRHDKSQLKMEIEAKKKAEFTIKNMITELIVKAKQRKKEEERLAMAKLNEELNKSRKTKVPIKEESTQSLPSYNINLSTSNLSSFSALKGRLNWPVSKGRIINKFGENINTHLNTVTLNYGIDIKTSPDAGVKAVAEGIVSTINWIPGYGSIVIITHKGNYRTVYSHLSEIDVEEGDKVKQGTLIGKVGESLEGNILHFEIWDSRKNQNPENWLVRR